MSCCKNQRKNKVENKLGGWSFEPELYHFLRENLPDGSTILELGSGQGTEVLSQHYRMISIEHNHRFVNKYNSTYIHAPMVGYWYDTSILESIIPGMWGTYDCILVDGPVGSESRSRIGFWENITMFDTSKLILVDDTNRDGEKMLFEKIVDYVNFNFGETASHTKRQTRSFKTFSVIFPSKNLEITE